MKSEERALRELVDRSIPTPSDREMESRCDQVLQRLQSENIAAPEFSRLQPEPIRARHTPWRVAVICAAVAAAVLVALSPNIWKTPDVKAVNVTEAVKPAPQPVNTSTSTTKTLADGSRIEMRAGAEAIVENVADGLIIRLNSGSMMVFAAKQAAGRHLYVQTRDLKVSVVGTVFLVKADDNGSRVAVIEGEVRVQQGAVETSLRPGEQFPSSPKSEDVKFFLETGWSREAFAYLSKLHESMAQSVAARQSAGRTPSVSDKPKFEEASIRLCEQDIQAPEGARGGGSGSIRITPGRVDALCMTVPTLINLAHRRLNNNPRNSDLKMNSTYGLGLEDGTRVRGGPEWVRSDKYTIAAQGDSTDALTLQGPMILDLLERRFKLKLRIETEEIPIYALTIAKGGLKIKSVESAKVAEAEKIFASIPASGPREDDPRDLEKLTTLIGLLGCSQQPAGVRNDPAELNRYREAVRRGAQPPPCGRSISDSGPNAVVGFGGSPIAVLADYLSRQESLADTLNGLMVVDKTGLPETNCINFRVPQPAAVRPPGTPCAPVFNFVVEHVRDESYFTLWQTRTGQTPAQLGWDLSLPKAQNIFDAVEKLGLHLEKGKDSREFIVIEHIEKPSEN